MLKTTTIKTWLDLFPENTFGSLLWTPPITHHIRLPARDGAAGVDCEVIFLALDQPKDVRKLLSLELTGAWVNEARELPKAVIDGLTHRVGRYPTKRDGGATWHGIWMDTNPMDDDHWFHKLAEKEIDYPVNVDGQAPTTTLKLQGVPFYSSNKHYYGKGLKGLITATDDMSKVASTQFSINGAAFTEYTGELGFNEEREYLSCFASKTMISSIGAIVNPSNHVPPSLIPFWVIFATCSKAHFLRPQMLPDCSSRKGSTQRSP
jgi:hypothetical protein